MGCRIGRRWCEKAGRHKCYRPLGSLLLMVRSIPSSSQIQLQQIAGLAGEMWPGFQALFTPSAQPPCPRYKQHNYMQWPWLQRQVRPDPMRPCRMCKEFWVLFAFVFCFSGPHLNLWHMEVPRLGVKSELQLPAYTTATAMRNLSPVCNIYHSLWQCQILNPLSEDWTHIHMVTSWVHNPLSHNRNSPKEFCFYPKSNEKQENGWVDSHLQWSLWLFKDHRKTSPVWRSPLWVNYSPLSWWVRHFLRNQTAKTAIWIRKLTTQCKAASTAQEMFHCLFGSCWHYSMAGFTKYALELIWGSLGFCLFVCLFVCLFFKAKPAAYGGSQARGLVRATAASLYHRLQQRQIWATSVAYTTAHGHARSLTYRARPGIKPETSQFPVKFVSAVPWRELLRISVLIKLYHQPCNWWPWNKFINLSIPYLAYL